MKKVIVFMAAACMAVAANARILRVSNVTGSSAPYSTFEAAHDAANAGDTIMIDASGTAYGFVSITKPLVVIGAGYYLAENGIIQEGANHTWFNKITIEAEGTVVRGVKVWAPIETGKPGGILIKAHKVVINRCYVEGSITLRDASNSIIHQNIVHGPVEGYGSATEESNYEVTNNFIEGRISHLHNSYVAYNTLRNGGIMNLKNSTVEHNIASEEFKDHGTGNSVMDNYFSKAYHSFFAHKADITLLDAVIDDDIRNTYGAFAGDSPYVISGIPSGPVIEDLIVPTTVEKGSKMQVTIKVGIQK